MKVHREKQSHLPPLGRIYNFLYNSIDLTWNFLQVEFQ